MGLNTLVKIKDLQHSDDSCVFANPNEMIFRNLFIGLIVGLTSSCCHRAVVAASLDIMQPSIEQEATSIWQTINNISFFEEQGYTIRLPQDSLIDSLIRKSKKGTFGNEDFPAIYALLETKIFSQKNYEQAIRKISLQSDLIIHCIEKIDSLRKGWDWNFTYFETYKVRLTLYGTGGSYDPDEGIITLYTDADGHFIKYENPANTIIHEIIHMGMEYSMIRKYKLPHGLKERLVDTFIAILFEDELPNYKIQNMGDVRINEFISQLDDINSLNEIVAEFTK